MKNPFYRVISFSNYYKANSEELCIGIFKVLQGIPCSHAEYISKYSPQDIACEQAHLFGVLHEYLGGTAAKASRRGRREE